MTAQTLSNIAANAAQMLRYDPTAPMLFSSGLFWALMLVFLPIFALLRHRKWQMMAFTIAFSLYFYYKSSGIFFLLLVCTSLLDWTLSRLMAELTAKWQRKACVWLSVTASLSILAYFKYANFFLCNFNAIVQTNFQPLDIILPVGISFYTFQSISYIVDIYKGRLTPTRTWLEYAFFLTFFPALVAGPIVRADYFIPQITRPHRPNLPQIWAGMWLIITGIIKKAVIADYISQYNDLIFASPTGYSGFESLMGAIGYTMQIYCDFSGYSDMAIGLALTMGFRLNANFNFPYRSHTLTEFWHRWHISLSTWLRDYIYIPLGGNRRGTLRTYLNNLLTMLIGGLWHGAAWKFIFWGAMHGLGLALHKALSPALRRIPDTPPIRTCAWILTMLYVATLWIFFRADSWADSLLIITNITTNFQPATIIPFLHTRWLWILMMTLIITAHAIPTPVYHRARHLWIRAPWAVKLLIFTATIQLVIQFMSQEVAPFIYFQF